jgi:hypothetical protein
LAALLPFPGMTRFETTVEIARSREHVFAYVADLRR